MIVTTHFMQEAEYCDRVAILDSGRIRAQGPPGEIRLRAPHAEGERPTMEDAFIAIVEDAPRPGGEGVRPRGGRMSAPVAPARARRGGLSGARLWALIKKEFRQIIRDPSSIAIGVVLPVILICCSATACRWTSRRCRSASCCRTIRRRRPS